MATLLKIFSGLHICIFPQNVTLLHQLKYLLNFGWRDWPFSWQVFFNFNSSRTLCKHKINMTHCHLTNLRPHCLQKVPLKYINLCKLTSLVHVTVGTGFPEAWHSKVTAVPFFTTMLPSAGFDLTLGGTAEKGKKANNFKLTGCVTWIFFKSLLSLHPSLFWTFFHWPTPFWSFIFMITFKYLNKSSK